MNTITTMDYDYGQWMLDEELELFSSSPLDRKFKGETPSNGVELPNLISPAAELFTELDAICAADDPLPTWMSETMSIHLLEEIQFSVEDLPDPLTSLLAPLPLEKSIEDVDEGSIGCNLLDLDILNRLVFDTLVPPSPGEDDTSDLIGLSPDGSPFSDGSELCADELLEVLSASSSLSSPASHEDILMTTNSLSSPASPEDILMITNSSGSEAGSPVTPSYLSCISGAVETQLTNSSAKNASGKTAKPSRRERKKDQNKHAATRYREKKRLLTHNFDEECKDLEIHNTELKDKVESISKEIKYLKDLMIEVHSVKGQLKEMGHQKWGSL